MEWEHVCVLESPIIHYYWLVTKYGVEPIIEGADQMLLQRNDVHGKKTLNFQRWTQTTYVKENYMLLRERVTVMTNILTSSKKISPKYLLKGKGVKVKLNPPAGSSVQWAEKGSYREDNL